MSDELKARRKLENWDRHTSVNTKAMGLWFMTSSSQDLEIAKKFQILLEKDSVKVEQELSSSIIVTEPQNSKDSHELEHEVSKNSILIWRSNLHARLAMIITCDQFSRCIFRGDAKAFNYDHIALALSKEILNETELMV